MIFIPESRDCVLCCLKCYICSSVPHTNLCFCHSCYTHQPCYQPNHTGSIWLRRKARSPGESVPRLAPTRLWLWILCFRTDPFGSRTLIKWWGYLGLGWKEKWTKKRERWTELGWQLYWTHSRHCRTSFWSLGSSLNNTLGGKNDQSNWCRCLRIPDKYFYNQWTFPVITWETPSEGIKIM